MAEQKYTLGAKPGKGERRLHLNEFRFDHHSEVKRAAIESVDGSDKLSCYVTESDSSLLVQIAAYVGVDKKNIVLAAGSDEILKAAVACCKNCSISDVIVGVPTYTHFLLFAQQGGLRIHPAIFGLRSSADSRVGLLELKENKSRLEAGALVYLGNPNNPTGDTWDSKIVSALAQKYPKSFFLIDEAYIEFETGTRSLVELGAKCTNVVIARTFSKAFGLAALRIGYAVGSFDGHGVARGFDSLISPKSVTEIAMRCASAVLKNREHYFGAVAIAREQRARLLQRTAELGWHVEPGGGNFMLICFGADKKKALDAFCANGIHVRDRSDLPELSGFVRITAGTAEDTEAVLRCIESLGKKENSIVPQKLYAEKSVVLKLRQMFEVTREILTRVGIIWWVSDGTLLGAMRHRGIIPWDDDIDISYANTEGDSADKKLADLVKLFAERGLRLQRNRTNAYWQVGTNPAGSVISPQHIDIFPYREVKETNDSKNSWFLNDDPRFRIEDPESPLAYCNTRYRPDELFPLAEAPFYDTMVPVPAQARDVLCRSLGGETWSKNARVRILGGTAVAFEISDFTPA